MSWSRNLIGKAKAVEAEIAKAVEGYAKNEYDKLNEVIAKAEGAIVAGFKDMGEFHVHVKSSGHIDKTNGGYLTLTIEVVKESVAPPVPAADPTSVPPSTPPSA